MEHLCTLSLKKSTNPPIRTLYLRRPLKVWEDSTRTHARTHGTRPSFAPQHTSNCVTASALAAKLTATQHEARAGSRLTPQPRAVVGGPNALDPDPLPAEGGQNQPLPEEPATLVDEPVACHSVVVADCRRWKSTCVYPGRGEWEGPYGGAGGSKFITKKSEILFP